MAGTVTVQGTASDNSALVRVDVSVDGQGTVRATGTSAWSLAVNTTAYANGQHTLTATAVDGAGNAMATSVVVNVQNAAIADTQAPSLSITSPAAGASVSGTVTVAGSAVDDRSLSRVEVAVDGGTAQVATGTTSWSKAIDSRTFANGSHTFTATAVDAAGNRTSRSVGVTVANTTAPSTSAPVVDDVIVQDPLARDRLVLLGRGNIATNGTYEVLLYWEEFTWPSRIVAHVKDIASGATSLIALPSTTGPWSNPSLALTPGGDLWVLAGSGPVMLRQYRLSGSPVPTSATLVSSRTVGDTDSRSGAVTLLASGAIVAVWHQQGSTGPQGHGIVYRRADGSWQEQFLSAWTKTSASRDALVQHPADKSVWLFNNADAMGTIAAAHFTELSGGLRVDWSDYSFIGSDEGQFDADPELPDIVAVADPYANDVVLTYQSVVRQRFTTTVIGSYPAIARLRADGQLSFSQLPVWVERSLSLGLSVRVGEVWLAYRLVDPLDLSVDNLELRVLRGGTWSDSRPLGKASTPIATPIGASFGFNTGDGGLHLLQPR